VSSGTIGDILAGSPSGARRRDDRAHLCAHPRARDPAIFITLRDEKDVIAEAKALAAKGDTSLRFTACRLP
jgi:hypothetical protein